ncbi:glycerophosphoryl diester phosphodiesterase [Pseudomonas rhodesiae]|uniref:glycerophosphoryl diester phosphodiesterase n=1 Tax=Pseudomonas rhodesiae TaxID=76760 RepID=UPI000F48FB82|nr:glycerophosphoryl diester phosphodiesterase [Pseudomonas rhodesiae]ROM50842.1 glycerophosphoryl diester phosphodiesterase [Pseudomonas rhodesiae]ROM61396.1 glycerophosphoryl diester phosphodiesterase [Pseudomonas rhodesiae]
MPVANPVVRSALIAHRGASAYAPENTLAALEIAAGLGAQWVEVDVKLTRDGQLVVIHDDMLERTTNGRGAVALHDLALIRQLDAGSWFSPTFAGTQVPTFQEVVECALRLGLGLQVELKPTIGDDVETAEAAIPLLRRLWPQGHGQLFVSSFSVRSLCAARRLWPEVPLGLASLLAPADPASLLAEYGCQVLHVFDDMLDEHHLRRLQASGVEFAVAIINNPDRARYLLANGAQSILSDYPDLLTTTSLRKL